MSLAENLFFLKKFFVQPLQNASVRPTSPTAAKLLVDSIDRTDVHTILELGPWTWPITEYIIQKMSPNAEYRWIERDAGYVGLLQKKYGNQQTKFLHADAKDLLACVKKEGREKIDVIVSALPYQPFIQYPYLLDYFNDALHQWTQIRCLSFSPRYFKKTYKPLHLRVVWFTRRNFPPMYVMGNPIQKK